MTCIHRNRVFDGPITRQINLFGIKECVSTVMLCIVIVYILPGKFILEQEKSFITAFPIKLR